MYKDGKYQKTEKLAKEPESRILGIYMFVRTFGILSIAK